MDNDDLPVGRILTRREVLALFGAAGVSLLAGCAPSAPTGAQPTTAAKAASTATGTPLNLEARTAVAVATQPPAQTAQAGKVATAAVANTTVAGAGATALPACVVRPQVTEGPYYVDVDLIRSDIRSDPTTGVVKEGSPLALTFNVSQVSGGACSPLQGAEVEIWHCDAAGVYSGVNDPGFNTTGQKWLRGTQVTDASGKATFTTIYPGWYSGRAVHIHFKVRPSANGVFTSQLFFDDAFSDQVFTQAPYASKGKRDTLNSTDNIYNALLLVPARQAGQGYAATFNMGVDMSTILTPQAGGGGPGGPGGGGPPPGGTRPAGGGPPPGGTRPAGSPPPVGTPRPGG